MNHSLKRMSYILEVWVLITGLFSPFEVPWPKGEEKEKERKGELHFLRACYQKVKFNINLIIFNTSHHLFLEIFKGQARHGVLYLWSQHFGRPR